MNGSNSSATPAHPSTREQRGLALARDRAQDIGACGQRTWRVPSGTDPVTVYLVSLGPDFCPCDDHRYSGKVCKHLYAALVVRAKRRKGCPSCFGGWITITVEEDGDERHEAVPCRHCAKAAR